MYPFDWKFETNGENGTAPRRTVPRSPLRKSLEVGGRRRLFRYIKHHGLSSRVSLAHSRDVSTRLSSTFRRRSLVRYAFPPQKSEVLFVFGLFAEGVKRHRVLRDRGRRGVLARLRLFRRDEWDPLGGWSVFHDAAGCTEHGQRERGMPRAHTFLLRSDLCRVSLSLFSSGRCCAGPRPQKKVTMTLKGKGPPGHAACSPG